MDDLSDINIQFDGKLSSQEEIELYKSLDTDFSGIEGDMSRPSSVDSFASWTLSPIGEHSVVTEIKQEQDSPTSHVKGDQPTSPAVHPSSSIQNPYQNQIFRPEQHPPSCEFLKTNTISYHQSVNIHNYVGNYCMGLPTWKPDFMWNRPIPANTPFLEHPDTTQQGDPLANLNQAGLEFTRCSTPEYLMALNSLNQLDSPPRPNHSAAFNCTASFEESMNNPNKTMNSVKYDSGYSSDLNVSPVIQFHNSDSKLPSQSTPLTQPQLLRFPPMPDYNKENIVPRPGHFVQSKFAIPFPGLMEIPRPQSLNVTPMINSASPLLVPGGYLQSTLKKPESVESLLNQAGPQFKSIADHQKTKKVRTESVKRKIDSCTSNDESDSKRRRHNEPLSNTALQVMNDWYEAHADNPYPSKSEKDDLAKRGGISLSQVKSWFANKRNRSHNTRPKKQKKEMEGKLLELCHQLARDASRPDKDNAYYIQQLSSILDRNKF